MLREGDIAPAFELPADDGSVVKLAELRGSTVVLFFYPRADTPGCTIEACAFRDQNDDFQRKGVVVFGISPDEVADVRAFRRKFRLPYRLLADADHRVAEAFGVWKEKSMFGKTYWGVVRTTFVVDESGVIARVYEKVDPSGHAAEVFDQLEASEQ